LSNDWSTRFKKTQIGGSGIDRLDSKRIRDQKEIFHQPRGSGSQIPLGHSPNHRESLNHFAFFFGEELGSTNPINISRCSNIARYRTFTSFTFSPLRSSWSTATAKAFSDLFTHST
jgi:hypothetical protein